MFRHVASMVLGVVVAAGSWVLFIEALGLPFKAFEGF